jgi:hypothetical protein
MTRRILVTGSRDWVDRNIIYAALLCEFNLDRTAILVSGACPSGADLICEEIWGRWGGHIERHPADWHKGRGAGFIRNQEMVDLGADVCYAFRRNGSRGTTHCANAAHLAGIPVNWFVEDDGDD